MQEKYIEYSHGEAVLEGYLASPDEKKRPAILIAHAWRGRDDFVLEKARLCAEHGYVGFALDMFGKGVLGNSVEENSALIEPFVSDRALLKSRMICGLEAFRGLPTVDASRVGAMGFCFGGMCVLDMARSGADVRGVVSVHGLLHPSTHDGPIGAKVLALHGYDDPMAKPEQALAFASEMNEAGVDWQLHAFGRTMHAFTNPVANDLKLGTVFNEKANERSWRLIFDFFSEVV